MIVVQALLMMGVQASDIRAYPLDERSVYTIRLAQNEPTTCVFPGPIKALVGANISSKREDRPGILLSHEPGTEYFSLRALQPDAAGALNIVFRGKIYALAFVTGTEPDQAVAFLDQPLVGAARPALARDTLQPLLDRAKQLGRLQNQYPGMASRIERAQPGTVIRYRNFTATVEEAARFDAEDVIVLRVKLANPGDTPVVYDPAALAVRVGHEVFPAALTEASGSIPPRAATRIYVVIAGAPGRGRANLSVREIFNVIVPRP